MKLLAAYTDAPIRPDHASARCESVRLEAESAEDGDRLTDLVRELLGGGCVGARVEGVLGDALTLRASKSVRREA